MQTIDIGIDKIDRIYHIADVHVRNVQRHTEYKQVFKRLYKYTRFRNIFGRRHSTR